MILESLPQRVSRSGLQFHVVSLLYDLYYVFFGFFDRLLDLQVRLGIGDRVPDTYAVTWEYFSNSAFVEMEITSHYRSNSVVLE